MARRSTLRELTTSPDLPGWYNVYVRLAERPVRVAQQGGRWQLEVCDLVGPARAFVCVHDAPAQTGLPLPYPATSPELVELFSQPELARLLAPGKAALVQGYAIHSRGVLYLNVPTVLLVRPFQLFGRQQIDLASGCPRKSYLAVAKRVRKGRRSAPHWGSVGGELAHALFAALAEAAGRGEALANRRGRVPGGAEARAAGGAGGAGESGGRGVGAALAAAGLPVGPVLARGARPAGPGHLGAGERPAQ